MQGTRVVVWSLLLGCGAVAACAGPSGPKPAPTSGQTLSAEEAADLRYVRENTSVSIPHRLNLAEEHQYRYVLATLKRFGRTPENAPQLFKEIERARQTSQAAAPEAMPADFSTSGGATLGGINYTTEFGQTTGLGYSTTSFSTYPSGQVPYNSQVLVSLIDTQNNAVIGSNQRNVFNTTNVDVNATGSSTAAGIPVESNALFLIAPRNGEPLQPFSVILTDSVAVTQACQTSPAYNTTGVQQCQTNTNTACVNNGPVTTPLKICYGPRIQKDCDYGCQGAGVPPNIIYPISGSVNLGQTPVSPPTGSLYIVMTDTTGGGCVLQAVQNTTGSLTGLINVSGSTASWNLSPASFPNQSCLKTNGMLFNYTFQLFTQTTTGFAGATFTSDTTQGSLPDTVIVPQIDIIQGCLPDGTQITTADGKTKAIESFQGFGDEQVRSTGGTTRTVVATTWGTEELPLIAIRDDKGHALRLTEAHPVITDHGVVMASALKVGDGIDTEAGPAKLVAVTRVSSEKPVPIHNLRVGSEEDAKQGASTFFANGILVGDQLMQRQGMLAATRPRHLSKDEILATLPEEWRQDYLNALAAEKPPKP